MTSFIIVVNGKRYKVEIGDLSQSPVSVTVNGQSYQVEVEKEPTPKESSQVKAGGVAEPQAQSAAAPRMAPAAPAVSARQVTAPMPGKVISIKVKVGDRVHYGDELCVLEAMKMELSIRAQAEGVVKAIRAEAGQSVTHGQVLVELE